MQIYQDFWGKVMLFQNERFNVNQINFVTNYSPEIKKIHKFPGKLPTYELMYFIRARSVWSLIIRVFLLKQAMLYIYLRKSKITVTI